jgi:titin
MDVAPIIKEGRTLLPVRYVADPLGAQVLWNEIERKVSIKTASKTIELWIDNNTASVNGQKLLIDPNNPNVMPIVIPRAEPCCRCAL